MDDRRLTAEAAFYVAIQTVVARIQLAANEPKKGRKIQYGSDIYCQSSLTSSCLASYRLVVFLYVAFRKLRPFWTGATINAGNEVTRM